MRLIACITAILFISTQSYAYKPIQEFDRTSHLRTDGDVYTEHPSKTIGEIIKEIADHPSMPNTDVILGSDGQVEYITYNGEHPETPSFDIEFFTGEEGGLLAVNHSNKVEISPEHVRDIFGQLPLFDDSVIDPEDPVQEALGKAVATFVMQLNGTTKLTTPLTRIVERDPSWQEYIKAIALTLICLSSAAVGGIYAYGAIALYKAAIFTTVAAGGSAKGMALVDITISLLSFAISVLSGLEVKEKLRLNTNSATKNSDSFFKGFFQNFRSY